MADAPSPPPPKRARGSGTDTQLKQPAQVNTAEGMREHGGLEAYMKRLREWWAVRKEESENQRKDRTRLLSDLVRVLSHGEDHDWASAIPQGLRLAAGRAAGKKVHEQPRVRSDPASRARLRTLIAKALNTTLSVAERDAECEQLLVVEPAGPPAALATAAAPSSSDGGGGSGGGSGGGCGGGCDGRTAPADGRNATPDAPITLKELMGPIVREVATATRSRLARAGHAARALEEFGSAVDAGALLPMRCMVLHAYLCAADTEGARRWGRTVHPDWVPLPLQTRWQELMGTEPLGDGGDGGDGDRHGGDAAGDAATGGDGDSGEPSRALGRTMSAEGGAAHPPPDAPHARAAASLTVGGRSSMPAALLEAGRLAVGGWGSSSFGRGRGRHGALVMSAQDGAVLGRGCSASAADTASSKRCDGGGGRGRGGGGGGGGVVRGGVHGKFVVHAEMSALRQALEASEGALHPLRGACVFLARLSPLGEHLEDAPPCERCAAVLRACRIARVIWTASAGEVRSCEYEQVAEQLPTVAAVAAAPDAPDARASVVGSADARGALDGAAEPALASRADAHAGGAGASTGASAGASAVLSEEHCQWMGVSPSWVH